MGAVWFVYRNIRQEMELAQLKSDFVSNISHELRTPLALIRMFAETLSMGRVTSDAQRQEYYQIIEQESERLTHLINNILNFSRIEAGRKAYQFERVMLDAIVEDVLTRYRFHLQHHGFQVETALPPEIPAVRADPEAVTEALLNLIDNSIKYSEDERWIRIRTGQNSGEVFLEVQDRGIGIAAADQDKIFEKFHPGIRGRRRSGHAGAPHKGQRIGVDAGQTHHGGARGADSGGKQARAGGRLPADLSRGESRGQCKGCHPNWNQFEGEQRRRKWAEF